MMEVTLGPFSELPVEELVDHVVSRYSVSRGEALLIVKAANGGADSFAWMAERCYLRAALFNAWDVRLPGSTPFSIVQRTCQSIVSECCFAGKYALLASELKRLQAVVCEEDSDLIGEALGKFANVAKPVSVSSTTGQFVSHVSSFGPPSGYVARCQCGVFTGAIDAKRTDRVEMGQIVGQWLHQGKIVEPRFGSGWSETLHSCCCERKNDEAAAYAERTKDIDILGW